MLTAWAAVAMVMLVALLNGFVSLALYNISHLPSFSAQSGDAMSMDAMASTTASEKPGKTIVIKGDNGTIIGHMSKLSTNTADDNGIETMSNVDKDTSQELLSIVGKY